MKWHHTPRLGFCISNSTSHEMLTSTSMSTAKSRSYSNASSSYLKTHQGMKPAGDRGPSHLHQMNCHQAVLNPSHLHQENAPPTLLSGILHFAFTELSRLVTILSSPDGRPLVGRFDAQSRHPSSIVRAYLTGRNSTKKC